MQKITVTVAWLACMGHARKVREVSSEDRRHLQHILDSPFSYQSLAGLKKVQLRGLPEQLEAIAKFFLAFSGPISGVHVAGQIGAAMKNRAMSTASNNQILRVRRTQSRMSETQAGSNVEQQEETHKDDVEEESDADLEEEKEKIEEESDEDLKPRVVVVEEKSEEDLKKEMEERRRRQEELRQQELISARKRLGQYWLSMCSAVTLTESTGLQPFDVPRGWMAMPTGPPKQTFTNEEAEAEVQSKKPRLDALLEKCLESAPMLCDPLKENIIFLARLAAWSGEWVRPLSEWQGEAGLAFDNQTTDSEKEVALLRNLTWHLLEKYDVSEAFHGALTYRDGPPISENCHRISKRFLEVYGAAGRGDSVPDILKSVVSPAVNKQIVKQLANFKWEDAGAVDAGSPLHAFRRAQVSSLGGEKWVADAACDSRLGEAIFRATTGRGPDEDYVMNVLEWVVRHQEELADPFTVRSIIDFFLEMKTIKSDYTCVGRGPGKVQKALEAYVASTFNATDDNSMDEQFQPNPRDIRGFFELEAKIPEGTLVRDPYREDIITALGGPGEPGSRPAVIRITECLSLKRLMYEGEQLTNCLEDNYRSVMKYLTRARQRVSSFWSLTKQEPGGEVEHLCLIEVWHLRHGNDVRQAEGPRPGTIPSAEAWYWMDHWCTREGIDLSTWDCYS